MVLKNRGNLRKRKPLLERCFLALTDTKAPKPAVQLNIFKNFKSIYTLIHWFWSKAIISHSDVTMASSVVVAALPPITALLALDLKKG